VRYSPDAQRLRAEVLHGACFLQSGVRHLAFLSGNIPMRLTTTRALAVFCIAARHLSFKSAAEELFITPSAVSHQIKALEEQLGTPLFERGTRSIALTPTGSSLYQRVDPLLRDLERITTELTGRGRRRVLRMTLLPFFASELFIPRLHEFSNGKMSIDLRLVGNDQRDAVQLGAADASILLLASPPREAAHHRLFPLRLVPACSPDVAERLRGCDPAALRDATLIVHKLRPQAWTQWLAQRQVHQREDASVLYLDSMYAVARAAERGLGVALVPLPLSDAWFGRNALVKLFSEELETGDSYYFVYRHDDAHDSDILALRDWVLATFGAHAARSTVEVK
jgi:LysR family transcriptional regulator, glycine cleavage system transcriptional activator